eukprot:3348214-Karenia_brevis.AAC.1
MQRNAPHFDRRDSGPYPLTHIWSGTSAQVPAMLKKSLPSSVPSPRLTSSHSAYKAEAARTNETRARLTPSSHQELKARPTQAS